MCLPIKFLQTWLSIATLITIGGGITTIVFGVIINKQIGQVFSEQDSVKNTSIMMIYIIGSLITVIGLIGLVGVCKKSGCCITIYNIFNLIVSAVLVIAGLALLIYFATFKELLSDSLVTCKNSSFNNINLQIQQASQLLCSSQCPCLAFQTLTDQRPIVHSDQGADNIMQCKTYQKDFPNLKLQESMMQFLENEYQCSGLCDASPIFVFSSLKSQKSQLNQSCGIKFYDYINAKAKQIGIFASILGVFLTLSSLFAFCLCCHPDRHKSHDYYDRMPY